MKVFAIATAVSSVSAVMVSRQSPEDFAADAGDRSAAGQDARGTRRQVAGTSHGSKGAACGACKDSAKKSCSGWLGSVCYAANVATLDTSNPNDSFQKDQEDWHWAVNAQNGGSQYEICDFCSGADSVSFGASTGQKQTNAAGNTMANSASVQNSYTDNFCDAIDPQGPMTSATSNGPASHHAEGEEFLTYEGCQAKLEGFAA